MIIKSLFKCSSSLSVRKVSDEVESLHSYPFVTNNGSITQWSTNCVNKVALLDGAGTKGLNLLKYDKELDIRLAIKVAGVSVLKMNMLHGGFLTSRF